MNSYLVVLHLEESNQRQQLGGLNNSAGPHRCIVQRKNMREVLSWLADFVADDVLGVEVHPIEREIGK